MEEILSLSELEDNVAAIIHSIVGGKHLRQRLINLGIIPGADVKIIRSNKLGPIVLSVQGSQVIIGRGMAKQIYVKK